MRLGIIHNAASVCSKYPMKLQVFNLLMVFVKNVVSSHSSVQPIKTCQVHEKINSLWNRIEEKSPSLQHIFFFFGEGRGMDSLNI